MGIPLATVAFFGGIGLILGGSRLLPDAIEAVATRLHTPASYTGFLTALGANSPEIATAIAAMIAGARATGYGVIVGSNLFNLAALLGLAAIVAGKVSLPARATAVHGGVGLLITAIGMVLVAGYLTPAIASVLIFAIFLPYLALIGLPRAQLDALPLPAALHDGIVLARGGQLEVEEEVKEQANDQSKRPPPPWPRTLARLSFALVVIVIGSIALLKGAQRLGVYFAVPQILVGALVLAFLSGLPNLYTAVRLGLRSRGRAVVSETVNSNTLNVIVGISIPSLVFGLQQASRGVRIEAWWLLGLTALALALTARRGGLRRREGAVIVAGYLAFVSVRVVVT
ncbi:MAG TPA: hypothetical protein VE127_08510 [Solirubrobacteraceae bacterium]|nr:hypothetical protein [Solirubrobacteraceae bacterium]